MKLAAFAALRAVLVGCYGVLLVCQEAAAKDCQACFESVDGFATTRGDLRANSRSLWLDSCGNTLRILSSGREATSTAVAAAADITASRRSLPSCSWRLRSRLSKNSTWTGQRQNRQDRTLSGFPQLRSDRKAVLWPLHGQAKSWKNF